MSPANTFSDWDNAVDTLRQGKGSINDITSARQTVMKEAQRQLLPNEISSLKGNIGKLIDFVQTRIKPEETGMMAGNALKTLGSVSLKSILPLLMLRMDTQTPLMQNSSVQS